LLKYLCIHRNYVLVCIEAILDERSVEDGCMLGTEELGFPSIELIFIESTPETVSNRATVGDSNIVALVDDIFVCLLDE